MANGSPHRNRVVVVVVVVVVACMCYWCVAFFGVLVCVVGGLLFLNTSEVLRNFRFIFTLIIVESKTPKSSAQVWYKIHVFYVGHTYQ